MDKPTSLRIPPDTRKALEAIKAASVVPVTLSAVAVEAMRRGVVELQGEMDLYNETVRYEEFDLVEFLTPEDLGDTGLKFRMG
jgi:hypothetical protein